MADYLEIGRTLAEQGECLPLLGNGMLIWSDNGGTLNNAAFQGLAAQASKRALYEVTKESYVGTGILAGNCRPVVFLHDEILAEVREEVMSECADEIARIMVSAMRRYTPDVLVKAEAAICRRWMKGMEPVRSKSGKLLPWWPTDWTWEPDQKQMALDLAAVNS